MAAFRPVTPLTVFHDNLGAPCAGGSLEFYESGTNDAKNVFSDEDLSVNLGSSVVLDSAGRAPSDIWGSGVYRVRLFTAEEVLVDEADPVQEEGAAGSAIPSQTGHSGKALFTNGATMSWLDVEQLPDMEGQAGKVLGTDGENPLWQAGAPTLPPDGVQQDGTSITVGEMKLKLGSDSAPSSGAHTTSKAVTFGVTFASAPKVFISPLENVITASGFAPVWSVKSLTTTGCTVHFDVNEAESVAAYNINTAIPFDWMAIGLLP